MGDGLYIPVATSVAVCMKAILDRDGYIDGFSPQPAHIGFCLREYNDTTCGDCIDLDECLDMRDKKTRLKFAQITTKTV